MKSLFQINDTLPNRISYYHLLLFFASLPFDRFYSQIILISFAAHTLIHLKKSHFRTFDTGTFLLLSCPFLLTLVGIFYTPDRSAAFQETDKQLALILFPFMLAITQLGLVRYQRNFLTALAASCTMVILYLYYDALKIIILSDLPVNDLLSQSFINHNFTSPANIHPTYLSMYAAFSFIYCMSEFVSAQSMSRRIQFTFPMVILAMGIVQLCSKSVLVAFTISLIAAPFFFHGFKRFRSLLYLTGLAILVLATILEIRPLRQRFFTELSKDLSYSRTPELTDSRIARWDAALSIINRAPVLGYGSGSEAYVLGKEYYSRKLYHSYLKNLNSHNQFLSLILKFGIAGIAIYLASLFYGLRNALSQRSLLFFSFIVLVTIVSLSENILDVNKGIFFYSSFFSLFAFSSKFHFISLNIKLNNSNQNKDWQPMKIIQPDNEL